MTDGSIRTQLDELLSALKSSGRPMSVPELSSVSGLPEKDVLKWLHVLEHSGQVRLENRLQGVQASWEGPQQGTDFAPFKPPHSSSTPSKNENNFQRELDIARSREQSAKEEFINKTQKEEKKKEEEEEQGSKVQPPSPNPKGQPSGIPPSHPSVQKAAKQMEEVAAQLEKVEGMISVLRMQKEMASKLRKKVAEKRMEEQKLQEKKAQLQEELPPLPQEEEPDSQAAVEEEKNTEETTTSEEKPPVIIMPLASEEEEKDEMPNSAKEISSSAGQQSQSTIPYVPQSIPTVSEELKITPEQEEELSEAFAKFRSRAKGGRKGKIQKPTPVHVPGVSVQYSNRLSRQVKKIIEQMQEIDKLRMEKEKLLNEHYAPMQRRLESEIDTISDRVLRMEKNILGMQERASNLPGKVSAAEKLQLSSINAHAKMRKAYDEATALIEESNRELSYEREKMETLVEQSRSEIAAHRAKTLELEHTLQHIARLEEEAANKVLDARAALAEQAERLSVAEKHAQELGGLKEEISEGVNSIKKEISNTKGVLTGIEKQMEQMRQVELYVKSIKDDYDARMEDLSDYVKHGNEEFDTLRESVEANFVRRYLKDLRELTESYDFEFSQARKLENSIDNRIDGEKNKLEQLIEESKKISQLYESQSKVISSSPNFEQRGEALAELSELAGKRTQIQEMVSQIISGKAPHRPLSISMPKVRRSQRPKPSSGKAGKRSGQKSKKPSKGKKK